MNGKEQTERNLETLILFLIVNKYSLEKVQGLLSILCTLTYPSEVEAGARRPHRGCLVTQP